jgi:hypothetical protein
VRATRQAAAEGTLGMMLERHLGWMAAQGTTTAEVKSGYGLDRDTELAMLDAAGAGHPIEVAPTFLGAHAVGPEWDDADAYLTFVIEQVLPQAAGRAEAADVFLERGAFDRDQAERYLRAAAGHGLVLRLHADQFSEGGAMNGLAVARLCEGLKHEGFTPDIVVGHTGWGELLFVKDIWPSVPLLGYFEFFYRSTGSDLDFDPEFPPPADDSLRMELRTRNTSMSVALLDADQGIAPTAWQASLFPPALRHGVAQHAIGADGRQQQSHTREHDSKNRR